MRDWTPAQVAHAAESVLKGQIATSGHSQPAVGPLRATIDSRDAGPGDLFVGLEGENVDGGRFAEAALQAGAWGVLVTPDHASRLAASARTAATPDPTRLRAGLVFSTPDPLASLQKLARAYRRALKVPVIAITGSVGKTSTKDLTAAMLRPQRRVHASRANFNTEIGLPLELLAATPDTEVLVLELAMRGAGQIAELAAICEPDVGVITNIGPVHLELLGSIEAIAAAKAELLAHLPAEGTAIVPAGEPLLDPHLPEVRTITFGPSGDVCELPDALEIELTSAHMRLNALAAYAAARAIGVEPTGRIAVELSPLRGQRVELPGGALVVNDCYNANPLSMRAALDDLAAAPSDRRRVAILGDMLELGPSELDLHREVGAHAQAAGVELLVTVGPLAAAMLETFDGEGYAVADAAEAAALACELVEPHDVVLVKASRGVGLEVVAEALAGEAVA